MSAIATLLRALVGQNDVIVHSGPLYAATATLIARILSRFGVSFVDFPAGAPREEIDAILARAKTLADDKGGKVALVSLESPSNPTHAPVTVEALSGSRGAAFPLPPPPPSAPDTPFPGTP